MSGGQVIKSCLRNHENLQSYFFEYISLTNYRYTAVRRTVILQSCLSSL